ncbi:MAG: hypothetical protein J7641_05400 [Cyanobacteria bacterium SID2]|nr:hypothetical protein [Cyanobacteria bacterium SID2]MBP0004808.1 hypothetical protein [Cyanobacteria bacterium SBC]
MVKRLDRSQLAFKATHGSEIPIQGFPFSERESVSGENHGSFARQPLNSYCP